MKTCLIVMILLVSLHINADDIIGKNVILDGIPKKGEKIKLPVNGICKGYIKNIKIIIDKKTFFLFKFEQFSISTKINGEKNLFYNTEMQNKEKEEQRKIKEAKIAKIKLEEKKRKELLMANPLGSFMGATWGDNVNEFLAHHKIPDQLKKGGVFSSYGRGFYLSNFNLGGNVLKSIRFGFRSEDGKPGVSLKKKNYDKTFFHSVYIEYSPSQFEKLLEIFKKKYGEPTKFDEYEIRNRLGNSFDQKVAYWGNDEIGRVIIMKRYADRINKATILLIPYNPEDFKIDKKESIESAADVL